MRSISPEVRRPILVAIGAAICLAVAAFRFHDSAKVTVDPAADVNPHFCMCACETEPVPGQKLLNVRAVFGVEASLLKSGLLSGTVYTIRNGLVNEGSSVTIARESGNAGDIVRTIHFRVVLCEHEIDGFGRAVSLGITNHPAGTGGGAPLHNDFDVRNSLILPGRLPYWGERIVYIEGDTAPYVWKSMSLDEFAKLNSGNHVVITMRWGPSRRSHAREQ